MECEERKSLLNKWILLTLAVVPLWLCSAAKAAAMEGEFVAGSFILTQKSLNEAPYRDAIICPIRSFHSVTFPDILSS